VKRSGRFAVPALPAIVLIAAVVAACAGKSSNTEPNSIDAFQRAYTNLEQGVRDLAIADVDRAYAFCLGPNDPRPISTPVPDPSGHSRAQEPCQSAASIVAQVLPAYESAVTTFEAGSGAPLRDKRLETARAAILKLHKVRLQAYRDIVTAAGRNDIQALAALRGRYTEIATLTDESQKAIVGISQRPK